MRRTSQYRIAVAPAESRSLLTVWVGRLSRRYRDPVLTCQREAKQN